MHHLLSLCVGSMLFVSASATCVLCVHSLYVLCLAFTIIVCGLYVICFGIRDMCSVCAFALCYRIQLSHTIPPYRGKRHTRTTKTNDYVLYPKSNDCGNEEVDNWNDNCQTCKTTWHSWSWSRSLYHSRRQICQLCWPDDILNSPKSTKMVSTKPHTTAKIAE